MWNTDLFEVEHSPLMLKSLNVASFLQLDDDTGELVFVRRFLLQGKGIVKTTDPVCDSNHVQVTWFLLFDVIQDSVVPYVSIAPIPNLKSEYLF